MEIHKHNGIILPNVDGTHPSDLMDKKNLIDIASIWYVVSYEQTDIEKDAWT